MIAQEIYMIFYIYIIFLTNISNRVSRAEPLCEHSHSPLSTDDVLGDSDVLGNLVNIFSGRIL